MRVAGAAMMDVEAALLEGSPTMSTISSDYTDQTYVDPGTPDSPVFGSKVLEEEEELTPKFVHGCQVPRKPKFRIRPPYLMICISIIEVSVVSIRFFINL